MNRRHFVAGCTICAAMAGFGRQMTLANTLDRMKLTAEFAPGYRPDSSSLEAGIWQQVEDVERNVKTSHLVMADDDLRLYLADLVCRLDSEYCRDFRVYPMRIPLFNATMYPNGMMQVWSGLLLRVANEAQLMTVLGHEMGHYMRRHTLKHYESASNTANFLSFVGLGLAVGGLGELAQAAQLAGMGLIFSHSRQNEREADAYGVKVMSGAGYNPWQAPKIWRRLIAENEVAKHKRFRDPFYASHPSEAERVKNLEGYAQSLGFSEHQTSNDTGEFQKIIGKHRSMLIEDQLKLRQYNQTELILNWMMEEQTRLGETQYYLGELYRMRDEAGDQQRAQGHYANALQHTDTPFEAHRALGILHLKQGDKAKANDAFQRYLQLKPEASDREMILSYIGDQ